MPVHRYWLFAVLPAALLSGRTPAGAATVTVAANPLWTDTGLILAPTTITTIKNAHGRWNWSTADPAFGPGGDFRPDIASDEWITNGYHGELIAFVGDNPYAAQQNDPRLFPVGAGTVMLPGAGGELWLGFNDDFTSHAIQDNSGSVTAEVTIGEAPNSARLDLRSGNNEIGQPDPQVWVQGHAVPGFGARDSGLPLQQAIVVQPDPNWAPVEGAEWISPGRSRNVAPGGYEYFILFAPPPGSRSARLDVTWRADAAELAVNGVPLPGPRASFVASLPPAAFHGEIMPYLQPGLNRLQFLTANAPAVINPSGVSFSATITFSP